MKNTTLLLNYIKKLKHFKNCYFLNLYLVVKNIFLKWKIFSVFGTKKIGDISKSLNCLFKINWKARISEIHKA